ncbi:MULTISPECIES: outer membrane protein transport protein [Sulfurimonas]|uniref:OmpP1/FadL family transporter n=1 Tax=Sulfurimonas TaxID=202746 RepID=UPI00126409C6|nr:outer membrane protein transport protein [Sulfurimonas indica]
MKKTIKLALVASLALGATSAFATNGAALIGMGAKARGMAGTGIGMSHGAESALVNPALITSVESTEISFGGTLFMPNVKNSNDLTPIGGANGSADSDADMNVIPEVSLATKINDNFYVGIGMWGTGGMGVDYRKATTDAQMNMVTNLQLMQFGVPLAYKLDAFSIAVTPILQYGSLDINYIAPAAFGGNQKGAGVAQDLQFGFNIGASYELNNLTVGAIYKSKIDMKYDGVLSNTVDLFSSTGVYNNDKLSTPAEIGIGASYVMGEHTVAIDYKQIQWSDAKGYKDFEWDDQNVISLGYEYTADTWAARVGYNYASSPISEQNYTGVNSANLSAGVVNTFNLLGFPGIVESHYAIGGTFNLNKQTSVDLAFNYAPEKTETYANFAGSTITTKHSQTAVSAQLTFDF